jgi:PAS domain S-box-containing protein
MSLKEHIEKFENNRLQIVRYWIGNENVINVLDKYNIDKEIFIKKYALGVLNYYLEVVNGTKKIGDCPVIEDLLRYLEKHKIKSEQLFILCSGFKNAMVEFMYEQKIASLELEKEINYYFEQNFSGVLGKFTKTVQEISKTTSIVDKYVIMSRTDINGTIESVSDAFCDISGYSSEELIGQTHRVIRHPNTPKETFIDLWETIKSGKIWRGEIKNLKKDGNYYWVDVIITPIFDLEQNIIAFEAIRQDITSKKDFEDQQHILVEQSKSAAMGEMISMIAHQWRQPLQAVSILIQKLPLTKMIEGEITDEMLDKVVLDIGQQLEYMSKTIDDFRDFFKPDKEKEVVLAPKAVDKALDFLLYIFKVDTIKLNKNIKDEGCLVSIHFNEVVQVLINIIKNARDAMLENETENRNIDINIYKSDKSVFIEIIDNAGGIAPEILTRIFEPYFSTKTNKNGTGLGLYMSKTIIEQHCNGSIVAQNIEGGAMFKIELPLSE